MLPLYKRRFVAVKVLLLVFSLSRIIYSFTPASSLVRETRGTTTRIHSNNDNGNVLQFFTNIIESSPLNRGKNSQEVSTSSQKNNNGKVQALKNALLSECRSSANNKKEQRSRIEDIVAGLRKISPTFNTKNTNAVKSKSLRKNWYLEYTTEKEINFFLDFGISDYISQEISSEENGSSYEQEQQRRQLLLQNMIEFKNGGSFGVTGSLFDGDGDSDGDSDGENEGIRTYFKFQTATLDVGKWGTYNFPPVGEGWFDTVYLDDDLRVDYNSRDDILICTPAGEM